MTVGTDIVGSVEASESSALECRGVSLRFPGVLALDAVDFEVRPGEIHALLGQNGAGKSTLVKVLTGVYRADEGAILMAGRPVAIEGPPDAERAGIAIVHQDSPLVPQFDVTRNVFLGREMTRGGLLDFGTMEAKTAEMLKVVAADFKPSTLARDLSIADREKVAIAGALVLEPSVLILDEPTASLGAEEVQRLFSVVRDLKSRGVTIIYISHHLDEVFELADRITVLRDGRRTGTYETAAVSRQQVIAAMVGRDLETLYPKENIPIGDVVLKVSDLHVDERVQRVSLDVRRGEIVGLAGLVGSGRTETALALFGASSRVGGVQVVDGRELAPRTPHAARAAGMALIPEDRRGEGLVTDSSVRFNTTIANLAKVSRWGVVSNKRDKDLANALKEQLHIAAPSVEQLVRNLSGGNQQKVVIARWLAAEAKVYIFDEPTTGVDVGSRVEIYKAMTEIARGGAGVLVISSDFVELSELCDRIFVIRRGRMTDELPKGVSQQEILMAVTGATESAPTEVKASSVADTAVPEKRRRAASLGRFGAVAGMLLVFGLMAAGAPELLAPTNLFTILKQGSLLAVVALALTMVLIGGGLDMSVGAIGQLTSNLAAGLLIGGSSAVAALTSGLAVGLLCGLFNILFVLVFRLSAFVTTLGTMFIAIGLSFAYNKGQALTLRNEPGFFWLGQGHVGPVPVLLLLVLALTAALHLFLKRTRSGLRMYAVGESPAAAALRGVSRNRALFIGFLVHGLLSGLSGVLLASYSYGASALATGLDFLISAFAAAFLGVVLSKTAELDVVGTLIAAIFISSINNGLILNGVSNLVLPGIQGAILIGAILIGVVREREIGQMRIF